MCNLVIEAFKKQAELDVMEFPSRSVGTRSSMQIHPTAILSASCDLGDDVRIGPRVVIEGDVKIGPGCTIQPFSILVGPLRLGAGNQVHSGVVLGERPQHLKYPGPEGGLEIGDSNVFGDGVTVHRGTTSEGVTRIGSYNHFMDQSHVAHDCIVGDHCVLEARALIGGHTILEEGCTLSANSGLHQFCRVGRWAILGPLGCATKDIPPYTVIHATNCVTGLNYVGLRRSGASPDAIDAVKRAYRYLFRQGLTISEAVSRIEVNFGQFVEIQELVTFIRNSTRGISRHLLARNQ